MSAPVLAQMPGLAEFGSKCSGDVEKGAWGSGWSFASSLTRQYDPLDQEHHLEGKQPSLSLSFLGFLYFSAITVHPLKVVAV